MAHLGSTARESLGAAEEYVKTKCSRGDIERQCQEIGVVFQPMIFESTGGVSAEAERVVKCLNKAVAVNSDTSEVVVTTRFWQRIGIDLLRAVAGLFADALLTRREGLNLQGGGWFLLPVLLQAVHIDVWLLIHLPLIGVRISKGFPELARAFWKA